MAPYLIVYSIVIILTVCAQSSYKKSKRMSSFMSLLCILVMSIFAACRGLSVGKDISVYGIKYFELAKHYDNLLEYIYAGNAEIGYLSVNFVIYKIFKNIHVLFFLLEFFNMWCIYRIAYRDKDNGTFFFYIFTYLFLWNNASFNIIRQTISMVILLYSFKFLEVKKYKQYYLGVIIAFLFHKSSIIALINPLIYWISNNKKIKFQYIAGFSIAYILVILNIKSIMGVIIKYFPTFRYYYNYLNRLGNFSFKYFIVLCLMLTVTLLFSKYIREKKKCSFLIYGVFIFTLLYLTSISFKYGYRIAYPYILYYTILIPRIDFSLKGHDGRNFYRIAIILIILVHWFIRCNYYDSTIPYVFLGQ